ncbi:hypothetical protein DID80_00965 [Candidatus Marinamargulisbacteria bacterium SCGC AAA071-K20]|nr:hypothetical protein DID80_00965 [Candidatus Marinamargulisbacteria bacterium SCGC AAA071-K20]
MATMVAAVQGQQIKDPSNLKSSEVKDPREVLRQLRMHTDNGGNVRSFFESLRQKVQGSDLSKHRRNAVELVMDLMTLIQRENSSLKNKETDIAANIAVVFEHALGINALTERQDFTFPHKDSVLRKVVRKNFKLGNFASYSIAKKEKIGRQFEALAIILAASSGNALRADKYANVPGTEPDEKELSKKALLMATVRDTIVNEAILQASKSDKDRVKNEVSLLVSKGLKVAFKPLTTAFNKERATLPGGGNVSNFATSLPDDHEHMVVKSFLSDMLLPLSEAEAHEFDYSGDSGFEAEFGTPAEKLDFIFENVLTTHWDSMPDRPRSVRSRALVLTLYNSNCIILSGEGSQESLSALKEKVNRFMSSTSYGVNRQKQNVVKNLQKALNSSDLSVQQSNLRQLFFKYDIAGAGENGVKPDLLSSEFRKQQALDALKTGNPTDSQLMRLAVVYNDLDKLAQDLTGNDSANAQCLTDSFLPKLGLVTSAKATLVSTFSSILDTLFRDLANRPETQEQALRKLAFTISGSRKADDPSQLAYPGVADIPEQLFETLLQLKDSFGTQLTQFKPLAERTSYSLKAFGGNKKTSNAVIKESSFDVSGTISDVVSRINLDEVVFKIGNQVLTLPEEGRDTLDFVEWLTENNKNEAGTSVLPPQKGVDALTITGRTTHVLENKIVVAASNDVIEEPVTLTTTFKTLFNNPSSFCGTYSHNIVRFLLKDGSFIDFNRTARSAVRTLDPDATGNRVVKSPVVIPSSPKSFTIQGALELFKDSDGNTIKFSDIKQNGILRIQNAAEQGNETKRIIKVTSPEGDDSFFRLESNMTSGAFKAAIRSDLNVNADDLAIQFHGTVDPVADADNLDTQVIGQDGIVSVTLTPLAGAQASNIQLSVKQASKNTNETKTVSNVSLSAFVTA